MNENKIFQIVGSKWFMFGLGIAMIALIPTTYKNLITVYDAGMLSKIWHVPIVFGINVFTAGMAFYKFASMQFGKKDEVVEW
jgi:hypothetical protein